MTSTEHSTLSVPPSPASPPSGHTSDCHIPRVVSFTNESLISVSLEGSLDLLGRHDFDPNLEKIHESKIHESKIHQCSKIHHDCSQMTHETANSKAKRSSSTSNDMLYERDRFRARFHSFNTTEICEEQQTPDECEVCVRILAKTKKLNVSSSLSSCDSVLEKLYDYSLGELASPLDSAASFYKKHLGQETFPSAQNFDVRSISVPQLSAVFRWYFNKPLPSTSHMFPWLHGLHQDNFTQRSFFVFQQLDQNSKGIPANIDFDMEIPKPQSARFIMCIESSPQCSSPRVLRNTVTMDEILQKIEYSRAEVVSLVKNSVFCAFPPHKYSMGTIDELSELVASDCFATGHIPVFLNLDPDRGVSLRNFHIQVSKLAKCSDFVVYCSEEGHAAGKCTCASLGRLLRLAQMSEAHEDQALYNVFVLKNHLHDEQDQDYDDVFTTRSNLAMAQALDSGKKTQILLNSLSVLEPDTFSVWDADYQVKEKVETTKMSAATQLHLNVWLGNIWDHEIMLYYWRAQQKKENDLEVEIVPLKDSRNLFCSPQNSTLTKEYPHMRGPNIASILPPPRASWKLFIHCHNDAQFPDSATLAEMLFTYTLCSRKASEIDDIHQLDFPSSGSIGIGDCKQESLMSIVNTCKLLYLYSSSVAPGSLASLIYCSDGYTELSLLVFCYLMYAENLPLDEAMIKLHLDYGRPFYIFNSDVLILRKLETLLRRFSPKVLGDTIKWSELEKTSSLEINDVLLTPNRAPIVTGAKSIPNKLRLGYIANDSDTDSSDSDEDDELNDTSSYLDRNWVEDVEGSFPSRILPYLYLGSLKHANNLTLLSKLGIKKVISVGEELDWLNGHKFQHNNDIIVDELENGNIEMYSISPKPTSFNRNNSRCTVETVMKVNNLQDDGIDELTKSLPSVLAHIDEEYRQTKGDTKILVHCRVGVSRSATVVIAEVMRRLGINLPKAYLYVRVRRLNIVIQPNLRFMYELFKWEEQERTKQKDGSGDLVTLREIDWFVMCREIKKLNFPFLNNR